MGRPARMKPGLRYTGTNLNHITDIFTISAYFDNKIEGKQSIRPGRSLALGHEYHALSPLARSRYSSLRSSSTRTSSAEPVTPTVFDFLLMIHAQVPRYFLENTLPLPVVENLGTEALSVNAHPVHHFIDKLSPIAILPPLHVENLINKSMEDMDEGINKGPEGEHNAERKGSSGSDLEVVGLTPLD
ncbi:hypothetical protein M9H77_08013 [Catharanthus roseus]|uniref:Uncharacterized protein n=1 Tax=Catharanthus roseus TaxID=4058 RepID=A0ACC0BWJ8_CATRO|nr:hypothetical protein M9H77_08013 [Catharanthus roseus]